MTVKTISNAAYIGGYTLASQYAGLEITHAGTVKGTGVDLPHFGMVSNYGLVSGSATGVQMTLGGGLANAAGGLIYGVDAGVQISGGPGSVTNLGTIQSSSRASAQAGVLLEVGGTVVNGAASRTTALINGQGDNGVAITGGAGTVTNYGTIIGYTGNGVVLNGGRLVNGATQDGIALLTGYDGVRLYGGTTATNFGTIMGAGNGSNGVGAYLTGGAGLTNGEVGHTGALMEGQTGVQVNGLHTYVNNYGVIDGEGGTAVTFAAGDYSDFLIVEAGCRFVGAVNGGGSAILDLVSGTGTLTGLLTGGDVTVSGSMPKTTFDDFGVLFLGVPASFTVAGNSVIPSDHTLEIYGTLSTAGTLSVTSGGRLGDYGLLTGSGTLALIGGSVDFLFGQSLLTVAKVTMAGAAAAFVDDNLAYAGQWVQSGGTVALQGNSTVSFSGTGDSFTGTINGAGTVAFSGGSATFRALTLSATSQTISASTITLAGVIDLTTILTATTPSLIVAAGGATLTGAGELVLSNTVSNAITGAAATATLTNAKDKILGAGLLGNGRMELVNGAGATIDANDALGLTIDTGTETVTNAGLIESAGAGGLTLDSAVDNTGTLKAAKGTLTAKGAVTGAGKVLIEGGVADFASTFAGNVTFSAAGGELELAKSQTYTGTITGFAKTSITSLDLLDIAFGAKTKATYSGTTTSGTLTVTDETHTARIKLSGDYTTSAFTVSSDGHGGTTVIDPPATGQAHAFIAAMAGFGAAGGPAPHAAETWPTSPPVLSAPGVHAY